MDDQMQALMSGIQQGQQQSGNASGPPSSYQPQGVPNGRNILCGNLKSVVDSLNKTGSVLNSQGLTQLANDLYKAGLMINTVCEKLEKEATGGQ